jgi:DNA-binding IclR family transcriptional regulator
VNPGPVSTLTPPRMADTPDHVIPNLIKGCDLLRLIAGMRDGGSLAELAKAAGIPKTTAYRMLRSFRHVGFAEEHDGRWRCGSGLIQIGLQTLERIDLRAVAGPVLRRLTDLSGETSQLAVPGERTVFLLDTCESPHPLKISSRPGTNLTLHIAATAKALLAFLPVAQSEALLAQVTFARRTQRTLTTLGNLRRELLEIQRQGYAVDDQEFHDEVRCVAAPVHDARGRVVAALGITATTMRLRKDQVRTTARLVIQLAAELSHALGAPGHGPGA